MASVSTSPFRVSPFRVQPFVSWERTVRPVVRIESFLKDRTPPPPPPDTGPAHAEWGKASSFQWNVPDISASDGRTGLDITNDANPDEDQETPPPGSVTMVLDETERETEDVRVENPDDSEQYVIVQRMTSITFQGPNASDGRTEVYWQLIFHHPQS